MCMCSKMKNSLEVECILTLPFMKTRQKPCDNFPASGEILPQIH